MNQWYELINEWIEQLNNNWPPGAGGASGSALTVAFGFKMAAHAMVPAANFASFLVGPEPKKIFGGTLNNTIVYD